MEGQVLIIGTVILICVIIVVLCFLFIRKKEKKKFVDIAKDLEYNKNLVTSTPVLLELSKIEPLLKNELMEEKYNIWQEKFVSIKENKISVIDDLLIDLDIYIDKRDFKNCTYKIAKAEMEIYKARTSADHLLEEIKEVTLSEEKYRSIVIKLKTKYRKINKEYQNHKNLYEEMQNEIELQLENIEKNFLDFEKVMEKNDYNEVVHIVKALDAMIDHMSIVVEETPDLLLMIKQLLPKRIKEIKGIADSMTKDGYPLDYLNLDYNIEESKKNINKIFDKVKLLNLEDCMFELKTILDYFDSLFFDFEKERLSRKVYEEIESDFSKKIEKTNKVVEDIYNQLEDIKKMYDDIKKNMNDLYIHNLETENKQLRLALQECRKALEDEITIKNKAIEYINDNLTISSILDGKKYYTINNYSFDYRELLDILKKVE